MSKTNKHDPNESTSKILQDYLIAGDKPLAPRWDKSNEYLRSMGHKFDVGVILTNAQYAEVRLELIQRLLSKKKTQT